MTKKDYILIASIFCFKPCKAGDENFTKDETADEYRLYLIDKFCQMLQANNVKFDVDKFKQACGL